MSPTGDEHVKPKSPRPQQQTQKGKGKDNFETKIQNQTHLAAPLPRTYTFNVGCPWLGLGTLGPDQVGQDGSYLSSSAWISGDYWNEPMT